jgi:hypothetical protein
MGVGGSSWGIITSWEMGPYGEAIPIDGGLMGSLRSGPHGWGFGGESVGSPHWRGFMSVHGKRS